MPLSKRAASSPRAQNLIRHAFQDLEAVVSAAHSKDFAATTLEHVQKAALEIENQLAARQSMRNMRRLMPLFSGLGHYSKAIEVLCNGTPYLPWLVSGFRSFSLFSEAVSCEQNLVADAGVEVKERSIVPAPGLYHSQDMNLLRDYHPDGFCS